MLLFLLNTTKSYPQFILSVNQTARQTLKCDEIWQLSIKNPTGLKYDNAKVSFELTNEAKDTIVSSEATIQTLNTGDNNLSSSGLFSLSYKNYDDSLGKLPDISKGIYQVCYKIITNTGTILADQCFPLIISGEDTLKRRSGIFKVYGNGSLLRFDSFGSSERPANPTNYTQLTGTTGISLFDIPANVNFVINQKGNSLNLSDSRISFGFDAQAVKESLTKRAKEQLLKEQNNLDFDLLNNKNSLIELNNLNDMFSNEAVQKELAQLAELESIEKLLKDSTVSKFGDFLIDEKDSLQNSIETKIDSSDLKSVVDSTVTLSDSIAVIASSATDSLEKYVDLADETKNVLNDSIQDIADLNSYAQLLERYNELKFIKEKKESYDKLIVRKKELEKRVGQAQQTIDEGKRYASDAEEVYNDPVSVRKYIEQSKYFTSIEKILYQIKTLRIGNLMPQFSNFTLSTIPVNGFQIEMTPFNTYEGFVTGKVAKPTGFLNQTSGERKLTAFGVGYGQNETSHLHFYYLKSNDKDIPSDTTYKPQLNQVISIAGKLDIVKGIFAVEAELAGSETVNDKRLASINDTNTDDKNFFSSVFAQESNNINEAVGYALSTTASITAFKKTTQISTGFKKISSGFRTHGNPLLINNNSMVELTATQSLLKNRITLGGLVQRTIASPDNSNNSSMRLYQYGGELGLNFQKFPVLRVSYQPLIQSMDTLQIRTNILNANLSYSFRTGKVRHQSNLNYLRQLQTGFGMIFSSSVSALHSVIFKDNSLVSLQYGYYENFMNGISTNNHITDFSYSRLFFKKLSSTVAISLNSGNSEKKIGGRLEIGYPLGKYLIFGIRGERNVYNNYLQTTYTLNNYNEWLLRTWLNFRF